MRYPIVLLLLTLMISGCYHLETREETDALGYRTEATYDPETDLQEGEERIYAPNGTLRESANYQAGKLDGERIIYFEDGTIAIRETYKDDEFDGPYATYDSLGKAVLVGGYTNGQMDETWTGYYPDGKPREVVTFVDNMENGPFREWHANGKPKASGNYLKGDHEQGILHIYAEDGSLERVMECDAGICATVWTTDSGTTPPQGPDMTPPPPYRE